jgi:hypothetical protein
VLPSKECCCPRSCEGSLLRSLALRLLLQQNSELLGGTWST